MKLSELLALGTDTTAAPPRNYLSPAVKASLSPNDFSGSFTTPLLHETKFYTPPQYPDPTAVLAFIADLNQICIAHQLCIVSEDEGLSIEHLGSNPPLTPEDFLNP